MSNADIVIIGSGIGGATVASALAPSGLNIIILERGEHLKPSACDRDDHAIFSQGMYRPDETWIDENGKEFNPGNYYYVGGNSKFFGAVFLRYRAQDFQQVQHMGGVSHGWPIPYETLEPYYQQAEQLFEVRGELGVDSTEPDHSGSYPYPPVPHEDAILALHSRLTRAGLHPTSIPLGLDLDAWLAYANTGFDAYPNTCGAKKDAETAPLAKALAHDNVRLVTGALAERISIDAHNRAHAVDYATKGTSERIRTRITIVAAGAVQSAALLLRSADTANPNGLANQSDQLGRNFMNHNTSAILALHPLRKNTSIYQKTLMANDYYLKGGPHGEPLGNIQMLGKITPEILKANVPLPGFLARWIAQRAYDIYVMSEDLPNPESRVTLEDNRIKLVWKRSNWQAHAALLDKTKSHLKRAGFPIVISKAFDRRTPSHQCGTARMGDNPRASVVNSFGKSHDHEGLYIVDASILPTSAAVNPSLTIAALALRAGEHITQTEFGL